MKTKREMPLSEALEEIASAAKRLQEEGAARVNGHEIKLDEPVTLEIETEAGKKSAELEFEIKWAKGKSKARKRGGGRRRLLLAVTGLALVAGAVAVMRRRQRGGEEEEVEV